MGGFDSEENFGEKLKRLVRKSCVYRPEKPGNLSMQEMLNFVQQLPDDLAPDRLTRRTSDFGILAADGETECFHVTREIVFMGGRRRQVYLRGFFHPKGAVHLAVQVQACRDVTAETKVFSTG